MRRATRLMASASASEEPPYFCTTMPTINPSETLVATTVHRRRRQWTEAILRLRGGRAPQHLIGDLDLLGVGVEVGVEAVVRDDGDQRVERRSREVAPVVDVGELPPPQRLVDVTGAEVAQAVLEVDGDRGQVVGEPALDDLGDVGVEDEGVRVDALEHVGQPQPQLVDVGLGTDVGLELLARREVGLGTQSRAGEQHLADLEQQQRDGLRAVALARDLAQREQEARHRVGDLLLEPDLLGLIGLVGGHSADLLPANARPSVTSSAYSRSPPTGSPLAKRVTRKPIGSSRRVRYVAVASPSRLGSVARIVSVMVPSASRIISSRMRSCSGPMPSIGEIAPPSTW